MTNTNTQRLHNLRDRIQKLPECYYSAILDIFICHQCIINETKCGINKGIYIVLDFIPESAVVELEQRVQFIETIEQQNTEIEEARTVLNNLNPETSILTADFEAPSYSGASPGGPFARMLHLSEPIPPSTATLAPVNTVQNKVTQLKIKLYQNNTRAQRTSATCFWCTTAIDMAHHVCIPTQLRQVDTTEECVYDIDGYGMFCRPECAAGFLMNESIDSSLRFERYSLLNQVYLPHSNTLREHGIPPAVSPHYVLDKFMGTLTTAEYMQMTSGNTVYTILKKPFTHILPELHENYVIAHE